MIEPISRLPCPFCGSTFAAKVEVKGGFRLRCTACDAQTGVAQTDELLREAWERRAAAEAAVFGAVQKVLADRLRELAALDAEAFGKLFHQTSTFRIAEADAPVLKCPRCYADEIGDPRGASNNTAHTCGR